MGIKISNGHHRRNTRVVEIGNVKMGGDNPIRIQTMTNTPAKDIDKTIKQCKLLFDNGAELVRITAPTVKDAENLKIIKDSLIDQGYHQPLVADIHYSPKAAITAARYVEKVRINPGNYIDRKKGEKLDYTDHEYQQEIQKIEKNLLPLLEACKKHNTAMRIGVNHGSLSDRIMSRFGDTPIGMAESALEFVRIAHKANFHQVVISMKSSNTLVMIEACRLLSSKMEEEDLEYPLHLGVTEAGNAEDGRIKSAVGIGTLLKQGIGDTIRVSLTEDPQHELPVAREIVDYTNEIESTVNNDSELLKRSYSKFPIVISDKSPDSLPDNIIEINENESREIWFKKLKNDYDSTIVYGSESKNLNTYIDFLNFLKTKNLTHQVITKFIYSETDKEKLTIRAACDFGPVFIDKLSNGIWIEAQNIDDSEFINRISFGILQASRARFTKTEFISCPGCGRTQFNLQDALNKVKEKTARFKGLKIAVMGCIVNGPGEMADADYGYVGSGNGKITLYKKNQVIKKQISENQALDELLKIIESDIEKS